jgi:hypothetical protein
MNSATILQRRLPGLFASALASSTLGERGSKMRVRLNHRVSYFVQFARWLD